MIHGLDVRVTHLELPLAAVVIIKALCAALYTHGPWPHLLMLVDPAELILTTDPIPLELIAIRSRWDRAKDIVTGELKKGQREREPLVNPVLSSLQGAMGAIRDGRGKLP